MAGFGLDLDTTITEEGIKQAFSSAQELKRILKNETIDIVCVSDLERTRQTVLPFISQFHILSMPNFTPKIVIIPCINELNKSGKNGNCYEASTDSSLFGSKSSRENYPACRPETCPSIKLQNGLDIDIDWSLYSLFYDNKMRSYPNLTDKPNCKDTNMVSMTVFYLLNYGIEPSEETSRVSLLDPQSVNSEYEDPNVLHIGGSRKHKKNVKLSRKNKLLKKKVTKKRRKIKKYRK
jgi:hypothetical protein